MELNKNYLHFKRWFKSMEITFHQGQYSDEQIAYSAYKEGQKQVKNCNIPPVINSVSCNHFYQSCTDGIVRCVYCNEPY